MYRAAYVVRDEKIAMLLVDPMRRTILNLLADEAHTQSQIAHSVGLTDASVGHHLRILTNAKLVRVVRREEEVHGIMQNFYRSVALCVVVDTERMPESVSKYFFPVNIERMRGAIACLGKAAGRFRAMDTKTVEKMAERLVLEIAREAERMGTRKVKSDREAIAIKIYGKALETTLESMGIGKSHGYSR
jgi:DNA-binding transcriptional ArsR family regulator